MSAQTKQDIVSSDSEALILVDSSDATVGTLDKSACHDGNGLLHRAFSLFVFNTGGELLIQQRAADKRLWPMYWSNTCCSHPRAGETMENACRRRLEQEVGIRTDLEFLYKFEYEAAFEDKGTEHELCWVYWGRTNAEPVINTTEINDWRWVSADALNTEFAAHPERFTPWFRMEWQRLQDEFGARLNADR